MSQSECVGCQMTTPKSSTAPPVKKSEAKAKTTAKKDEKKAVVKKADKASAAPILIPEEMRIRCLFVDGLAPNHVIVAYGDDNASLLSTGVCVRDPENNKRFYHITQMLVGFTPETAGPYFQPLTGQMLLASLKHHKAKLTFPLTVFRVVHLWEDGNIIGWSKRSQEKALERSTSMYLCAQCKISVTNGVYAPGCSPYSEVIAKAVTMAESKVAFHNLLATRVIEGNHDLWSFLSANAYLDSLCTRCRLLAIKSLTGEIVTQIATTGRMKPVFQNEKEVE